MSHSFDRRLLVDTAVFAYAQGGAHQLKPPCQAVLRAAENAEMELHASVEMVQELLFHRMRRVERPLALQQAHAAATLCHLHPFDAVVLSRSFELIAVHRALRGRDAVHAATALVQGLPAVLSPDTAFDGIPGVRRVDPRDLADLLA